MKTLICVLFFLCHWIHSIYFTQFTDTFLSLELPISFAVHSIDKSNEFPYQLSLHINNILAQCFFILQLIVVNLLNLLNLPLSKIQKENLSLFVEHLNIYSTACIQWLDHKDSGIEVYLEVFVLCINKHDIGKLVYRMFVR